MQTYTFKKTISSSNQIVIELPEYKPGEEIELVVIVNPLHSVSNAKKKIFDMVKWADEWETDLGDEVNSTKQQTKTAKVQ